MHFFKAIFGGNETVGRYPESLIQGATERAVNGTDPRLRVLPGYRKLLRAPIIAAIDHVVESVAQLPGPLPAARRAWGDEPALSAMFASPQSMFEAFARARDLREFLDTPQGGGASEVFAMVAAERGERHVLGMDLIGDQVRREVAQVAVNFAGQRLVEPAASLDEAQRQLRHRAFDHLLLLALARMNQVQSERADLLRERDLLRRRQATLERGGCGLEGCHDGPANPAALARDFAAINAQLAALGNDTNRLRAHLDILAETLRGSDALLHFAEVQLHLDAMNIVREPGDPAARLVCLKEMHSASGRRLVLVLVRFDPAELPPRDNFLAAAARYQY